MSGIYLGNGGLIKLRRLSGRSFNSVIDDNAVNVSAGRLELDFGSNVFTTGDRVSITSASPLDFINGYTQNSVSAYVNVDTLGGIRLYDTWKKSINNDPNEAFVLADPASPYTATFELLGDGYRDLGQILSYTLSTSRNSVDVTALGDAYSAQIGTLISGSGSIECLWDYSAGAGDVENSMYFHQLILRQQLGSTFKAALVLKTADSAPVGGVSGNPTESLYYLINAVVTNVAMSFEPSEPVRSTIDFATTGLIAIRYGDVADALLLQESEDEILLEQSSGSLELEAA
ncbi:MAG: hypothetical protein EBV86_03420 [Marivivens sp.]|jgi:hypothetical protein|nr:hypothetical protein [Marivivens sp.]